MELIVTANNKAHAEEIIEAGAEIVIIADEYFSLRTKSYFTREEIIETTNAIHNLGGQVYLNVGRIMHNEDLHELKSYLNFLNEIKVDGIVCQDPSILVFNNEENYSFKLMYNPETNPTSTGATNFYFTQGISKIELSKEITLDQITLIGKNSAGEVGILGHGYLPMMYSKRSLVGNYLEHSNIEQSKKYDSSLKIYENIRKQSFPIFEDQYGTHLLSANVMSVISELNILIESNISFIRIDGLLMNETEIVELTKIYRTAIDLVSNDIAEYIEYKDSMYKYLEDNFPYKFDKGFLYKKTIYKVVEK